MMELNTVKTKSKSFSQCGKIGDLISLTKTKAKQGRGKKSKKTQKMAVSAAFDTDEEESRGAK